MESPGKVKERGPSQYGAVTGGRYERVVGALLEDPVARTARRSARSRPSARFKKFA